MDMMIYVHTMHDDNILIYSLIILMHDHEIQHLILSQHIHQVFVFLYFFYST
jgi:hypothetical protein